LVFGELEIFHPLQSLDQLVVLVGGQRGHQLTVDVAAHRARELRPSVAARIDAEEPGRREVETVAHASAEETTSQKAAHESADERFAQALAFPFMGRWPFPPHLWGGGAERVGGEGPEGLLASIRL